LAASPSVATREAGTSTPATRPVKRRPSASHIMIALAALLAFVFNFLALQGREATTLVALADRPIAEGTPFTRDLVRLVPIPAEFEGISHLVAEPAIGDLEGWIMSRSVTEGELIDRAIVIAPGGGDGLRTMSLPVPIEHAAGATLVVGDRIDVISVIDGTPAYVAVDLEVVAIADVAQTGLSGVGAYHLVVAVDADGALALAKAIDAGSIEVIRSTGAAAPAGEEA
jgi:Flp pilus assembly protein CpaB